MLLVLVGFVLLVGICVIWSQNRRLPGEHVFRASRLSRGNRIFPAQVVITPHERHALQPQWIGKLEESIHMAHVASIKIDTNMMFSDVLIETTGGHNPIVCHGHSKGDAMEMKKLIERFQTDYYKGGETQYGLTDRHDRPIVRIAGLSGNLSNCVSSVESVRSSNAHGVKPAVDHQHFAGDAAAGRTEQEHRGVGDVAAVDGAAERRAIAIGLQNRREAGDARRGQRLDRAGGDRVDADVPRAEIGREVADGRFERGFGDAHHVVVREHALAAEIGERQDAAAAALLHQRRGAGA